MGDLAHPTIPPRLHTCIHLIIQPISSYTTSSKYQSKVLKTPLPFTSFTPMPAVLSPASRLRGRASSRLVRELLGKAGAASRGRRLVCFSFLSTRSVMLDGPATAVSLSTQLRFDGVWHASPSEPEPDEVRDIALLRIGRGRTGDGVRGERGLRDRALSTGWAGDEGGDESGDESRAAGLRDKALFGGD